MKPAPAIDEPDFNPEDEQHVDHVLGGEFTRPHETFRGEQLWPYTPGTRSLFAMVLSATDTKLYRILAFIYIHLRRGESEMETDIAKHVVPLVWDDLDLFRFRVLEFRGTLTDEELADAIRIASKELNLEAVSEVVASPPESAAQGQKKSRATTRRKSAGKSTRRQKTSG